MGFFLPGARCDLQAHPDHSPSGFGMGLAGMRYAGRVWWLSGPATRNLAALSSAPFHRLQPPPLFAVQPLRRAGGLAPLHARQTVEIFVGTQAPTVSHGTVARLQNSAGIGRTIARTYPTFSCHRSERQSVATVAVVTHVPVGESARMAEDADRVRVPLARPSLSASWPSGSGSLTRACAIRSGRLAACTLCAPLTRCASRCGHPSIRRRDAYAGLV